MTKAVTVINGYHYGMKRNHPFIYMEKSYNFKVTRRTHHINRMKRMLTCSVLTRFGKKPLVIARIRHISRPTALVDAAKKLKPVINFHVSKMPSKFLYKIMKSKI